MDDPSDEAAQREVGQWAGLPVRAMIAPPSDVRAAIRVYYGVGKDTASLSEAVAEVDAEASAGVRAKSAPPRVSADIAPESDRTPVPGTMHVVSPREAPPVTVASVKPAAIEPGPLTKPEQGAFSGPEPMHAVALGA